MAGAGQVVQSFMGAMGKGDFTQARKYLLDNLSFRGPIDTFDKADAYLQRLETLHKMVERVDMKKMFVDGDDVCLLYDLVTNTPAGTSYVCEWMQVKGDKIAAIRVVFDPRPFVSR